MLQAVSTSGLGASPSTSLSFLAPFVTVTVGDGHGIHVVSAKAFGTTAPDGAGGLNLFICRQSTEAGSTITTVGGGILGNRLPQNSRVTMDMSAVIKNLPAGSYRVGMCGTSGDAASWNSNEYGYTTAMVIDV